MKKHYRTSFVFLATAVLVLALGFGAGWYLAAQRAMERDDALVGEAQAKTNEDAARAYLQQACENDIRSACQMVRSFERQDKREARVALEEQQGESEVQESEIQESEIQESEEQEPDTFCRDNPIRCQGIEGEPGAADDGRNGADGEDGEDGTEGVDGINGTNGADGRSVTGVFCNSEENFEVNFSDGTSDTLEASDCVAQRFTATSASCSQGTYVEEVFFSEDGKLGVSCRALPSQPDTETPSEPETPN